GSVRDRVNGRAHRCCKINPCMQAATSRDRVGPHSIVGTDPKHSRWERGRDAYGAVARVSELGLAGGYVDEWVGIVADGDPRLHLESIRLGAGRSGASVRLLDVGE